MSHPSRFGFVLHNCPSSLRPRPGCRDWVRFARSSLVPLAIAGNWLCLYNNPRPLAHRPRPARPCREIGFVCTSILQPTTDYRLLTTDYCQIGFVFSPPLLRPIRHNSLSKRHLSFFWPVRKLGLFGAEWWNDRIVEWWGMPAAGIDFVSHESSPPGHRGPRVASGTRQRDSTAKYAKYAKGTPNWPPLSRGSRISRSLSSPASSNHKS